MKEYIINSGEFNVLVRPSEKRYYILDNDEASIRAVNTFLQGDTLDLAGLESGWFKYRKDEAWSNYVHEASKLNVDLSEDELIDRFVQKKFNFGGLVAERDAESGKVKIFKKHKLPSSQM